LEQIDDYTSKITLEDLLEVTDEDHFHLVLSKLEENITTNHVEQLKKGGVGLKKMLKLTHDKFTSFVWTGQMYK